MYKVGLFAYLGLVVYTLFGALGYYNSTPTDTILYWILFALEICVSGVIAIVYRIKQNSAPQEINVRHLHDKKELVIMGSRSHGNQELQDFVEQKRQEYELVKFIPAGSSLKFTLIAEGKADIYPRLGPTMEWDTAAAHAIVLESGKKVYEYGTDRQLKYNKENLLNPWFIVK